MTDKITTEKVSTDLVQISSKQLFEEVAKRLMEIYKAEHGQEFRFGIFEFVVHDGRFQGIEEHAKNKRFWNQRMSS